jgi:hypothetical protein
MCSVLLCHTCGVKGWQRVVVWSGTDVLSGSGLLPGTAVVWQSAVCAVVPRQPEPRVEACRGCGLTLVHSDRWGAVVGGE